MAMFRKANIAAILVLLFISSGAMMLFQVSRGLDQATSDLYITANSQFSTSSFVRSGSGTQQSPYMISDWNMSTYSIRLESTTSYVVIRNITFTATTSWAFYFVSASNIYIENVSCTGRGKFLYSSACSVITLDGCTVTSIPTDTYVVQVVNGVSFTITDCSFAKATSSSGAPVYFNNQGSQQRVIRSQFQGIALTDALFGTDGLVQNCTFLSSPVILTGGDTGATITESTFDSPGSSALTLVNCRRMTISANFFRGNNGIFCQSYTWGASATYGRVERNTFEGCLNGVLVEDVISNYFTYYEFTGNYFGNCSTYAMNLNYGLLNKVWRNIFYHNAGTFDSGGSAQCSERTSAWAQYKNLWTVGSEGNHWANHRGPDDDNNGIVDVNYTVPSSNLDTKPYKNRYFDTVTPTVSLLTPKGGYSDRSYLQATWDSEDGQSGIRKVELYVSGRGWYDVTNVTVKSLFLMKGSHILKVRAWDRGDLWATHEVPITLNKTVPVLTMQAPMDEAFIPTNDLDMFWKVESYFEPVNQSLQIDGDISYLPPSQRVFRPTLAEGRHRAVITLTDPYGLLVASSINFTVDVTEPEVEVISPQEGAVLSNYYVTFMFQGVDNFGLSSFNVRVDNGTWVDRSGQTSYVELLGHGPHTFEVLAVDQGGLQTLKTVDFQIGGDSGLTIMEPENGTVTSASNIRLIWDYTGSFIWDNSFMRVGRAGQLVDIGGIKDLNIPLSEDGAHEITIRLVDGFDNYIENWTTVIRDIRPPIVEFRSPSEGVYLNTSSVNVSWLGLDNTGLPISGYSLKVDETGDWTPYGTETSTNLAFDEGEHTLYIKAVDRAGNVGQSSITFMVDLTRPTLRFLEPADGSMVRDSAMEIRWEADDNYELHNLSLLIDDRIDIVVLGRTSYMTTLGTDGYHKIDLIATDLAGNSMTETISVLVDLSPPFLQWVNAPEGFVSAPRVNISWTVDESFGLASLSLDTGLETISLDPSSHWVVLDLPEGTYSMVLTAVDRVGWDYELFSRSSLTVDLTRPYLYIDLERTTMEDDKVVVYWVQGDNLSGLASTMIRLDEGEWSIVSEGSVSSFDSLSPGEHHISVNVTDKAGNGAGSVWSFTILPADDGPDDDDGRPGSWLIFAVLATVFIAIVVIFLLLFMLRRKKREEDRLSKVKRPGRPGMAMPGIAPKPSLAGGMGDASNLPPVTAAEQKVETTEEGSGYIRPKKRDAKGEHIDPRTSTAPDRPASGPEHDHIEDRNVKKVPERTPWDENKAKVLEEEARSVFVGQQPTFADHDKAPQEVRSRPLDMPAPGRASGGPVEGATVIPVWDEDEGPGPGTSDRPIKGAVPEEELEELEELDELEEAEG